MSYHLVNIETSEYYYCDDQDWINAINIAKEDGWKPDGTMFDMECDIDDACYGIDDEMYCLYMYIQSKLEYQEWDGNYFEKRNQIVMYEDSLYLSYSLEAMGVKKELVDFVKKGSFRICSE